MKEVRIVVRCEQDEDHAKKLRFMEQIDMKYVQELVRLIDGTSPLYIHRPGPGSPLARCAICGGKLSCTIEVIVRDAKPE